MLIILVSNIIIPACKAMPIDYDIDKEPDEMAGKINFFNFTKPQKPSNLVCETSYQVVMCLEPFKLFEKALVQNGYLSWISDYKSNVISGQISPSNPEFDCNQEMTKYIIDEEEDLDGFICLSNLQKSSNLDCETNFQASMCGETYKLFERAREEYGYEWVSDYKSKVIIPDEVPIQNVTSSQKAHPLLIALLSSLIKMINWVLTM